MVYDSGWVQLTIVLNTVHLSLLSHYLLYEGLSTLFHSRLDYPQLPTITYLRDLDLSILHINVEKWGSYISPAVKTILVMGTIFGTMGSANGSLALIILNLLICGPLAVYVTYQMIIGNLPSIDVENFFLFQVLFLTTLSFVGQLTILANFVLFIQLLL